MTTPLSAVGRMLRKHRAWAVFQGFQRPKSLLSLSFWCVLVLVAALGAFVLNWRWTHSSLISSLNDDPWGVTTPLWVIEITLALLMFGCLAEACGQALHGNRNWKCVAAALIVVAVSGSGG
jgi:hypothetical protein